MSITAINRLVRERCLVVVPAAIEFLNQLVERLAARLLDLAGLILKVGVCRLREAGLRRGRRRAGRGLSLGRFLPTCL